MADFEGMPVKTLPKGVAPPTRRILREREVPFLEDPLIQGTVGSSPSSQFDFSDPEMENPYGPSALEEYWEEAESNPLSAAQQYEEGLKQLYSLYDEHTSIPAPTLYGREDPKFTESRERAIDQLASKLGLESPLGYVGMKGDDFPPYFQRLSDWIKKEYKGPGGGLSAEYQGPGPSALEKYYEARDKPGSEYRLGESILEEDPLVQGMAEIDDPFAATSGAGERFVMELQKRSPSQIRIRSEKGYEHDRYEVYDPKIHNESHPEWEQMSSLKSEPARTDPLSPQHSTMPHPGEEF